VPLFMIWREDEVAAGRDHARQYPARPGAGGHAGLLDRGAHARQGYMREAIEAVVHYAFRNLDLSRIEAACLPENAPRAGCWRRPGSNTKAWRRAICRSTGAGATMCFTPICGPTGGGGRIGVTAATDYTGFLGATAFLPDIVTMNIAHSSHFTRNPDPAIPHVLPGWGLGETPAQHNLRVEDVLVRNVPTDIRSAWQDGRRDNGNSIFIFEVAGLCIGHLGHLHHEPSEAQYAAIGRLDVVMAPVDGGYTLDRATMVRVLTRLRSSLILPMHWFGQSNLDAFLADMEAHFTVVDRGDSAIEVSLRSLPATPTVWLLRPRYLHDDR
jgi:L-ascorbate metabolism protein UlaG (beta-lactamase superfamily)